MSISTIRLTTMLLASPTLVLPAGGAGQEPPGPRTDEVFELVDVGDGVWAAVVLPRPAAYAFANSLVVEGEDGVLVVDTQQSTIAARALIESIRERTERPVRWVVNTHWHGDHVYGNQAYRAAYGDVTIVAHDATRDGMMTEGRAMLAEELESVPVSIEEREEWLRSGLGPGDRPLTPEDRAAVEGSLALRKAYLDDLRGLSWTPPDVTFSERATIHMGGGRTVELIHVGPAHTKGDIVVRVPDLGVVAVGDLLEEGPPWLDGADLPGWRDALARIEAMEPSVVLPAHGGVHRDRELLAWEASFFRDLLGAAETVAARDGTAEELVASGALDGHRDTLASLGLSEDRLDAWLLDAARRALGAR